MGQISIKTVRSNGTMAIIINDTGVGIPADKLSTLLQIDKNHSTRGTENESGIGLGLILSNEFIKMNKSEMIIESEVNKGSSFSFTLPLSESATN